MQGRKIGKERLSLRYAVDSVHQASPVEKRPTSNDLGLAHTRLN
jgi:hypothetical protein